MTTTLYRIETERLIIRCYQPSDASALRTAIADSLDHLQLWLPWAKSEPETVEAKVQRLRQMRARFDLDQDYVFGVFSREKDVLLGGTGLHRRGGPESIEIGYWLGQAHEGKGYMTEVAGALTRVALEHLQLDRVEIRCDPDNLRSKAVPERLGFTPEARLRRNALRPDGSRRDTLVYCLFHSELESAPAGRISVRGYDVLGEGVFVGSER